MRSPARPTTVTPVGTLALAVAVVTALVTLVGTAGSAVSVAATPLHRATEPQPRPAVVEHRVIGHTVKDRPIHAWRVGDPDARRTVVLLASLHGDEAAPRRILRSIRDGRPVSGVNLWLVPTMNPDGVARHTRHNARGVDLNRNFPREWAELDGVAESGPGPASEPETRAVIRFLRGVDPRFVVSFHQPLHGIDTYGSKQRWFARRLARELRLPAKEFSCGNGCHGTLTQWFNHRFDGVAVTVEYGEHPPQHRMERRAPRQLLRAVGGTR